MTWQVRVLTPPFDDYYSIAGESLLFSDPKVWETYIRRVGAENLRGVYSNNELRGGLAFYPVGQWFGGAVVPVAAVSGVAIEPAARGTGACGALLDSFLCEAFEAGIPLATLYASTQYLYRSRGFEQSGHRLKYSSPIASLAGKSLSRSLHVRRYQDAPYDILAKLDDQRGLNSNGLLQRNAGLWERISHPFGEPTSTYVIGDASNPVGYAVIQHGNRSGGFPATMNVIDYYTSSPEAMQRFIALLVDHRSMCSDVTWFGGPEDPLLFHTSEYRVTVPDYLRLLSRIISFPGAIEARGYPTLIDGKVAVQISDRLLPENNDCWEVEFAGGNASVKKSSSCDLRMSIDAAATLYSGMMSCSQLMSMGRIQVDNYEAVSLMDLAFSGPASWTPEVF